MELGMRLRDVIVQRFRRRRQQVTLHHQRCSS